MTSSESRMRSLTCAGLAMFSLVLLVSGSVTRAGTIGYAIVDLGTLGGTESVAYAINDDGDIVGRSWMPGDRSSHSFLYSRAHLTDLYPFDGSGGINSSGQVAGGVVHEGIYYPAIYDSRTGQISWALLGLEKVPRLGLTIREPL